jgi:hypothetical protein
MEFIIEMSKWKHEDITNYILSNGKGPKMACPIHRMDRRENNILIHSNTNVKES